MEHRCGSLPIVLRSCLQQQFLHLVFCDLGFSAVSKGLQNEGCVSQFVNHDEFKEYLWDFKKCLHLFNGNYTSFSKLNVVWKDEKGKEFGT